MVSAVIFVAASCVSPLTGFAFWETNLAYEGESIYNYLQVKNLSDRTILSTNVLFGVQSVTMKDKGLTGMYYDTALAAPALADNANSALIVAVNPSDYPGEGPLAGIAFQRELERRAFLSGEGRIPVQLFGDFKENRRSAAYRGVLPDHCGGDSFANLRAVLPEEVSQSLILGMEQFGGRIPGFDRPDVIFSGVESRTSSPVRIERDEHYESPVRGLFPCGEGAGYAGGITSAAVDGIKIAEEIMRRFRSWT